MTTMSEGTWTTRLLSPDCKHTTSIVDDLNADFNDSGGGYKMNEKTGKMEQIKNQDADSREVQCFVNNMEEPLPVYIIIGQFHQFDRVRRKARLTIIQAPRIHIAHRRCPIGTTPDSLS